MIEPVRRRDKPVESLAFFIIHRPCSTGGRGLSRAVCTTACTDIAPGSGAAAPMLANRPPRFCWWASEGVLYYAALRCKTPKNTIIVVGKNGCPKGSERHPALRSSITKSAPDCISARHCCLPPRAFLECINAPT